MSAPALPKIGACLIVKNESKIIERCLDSLRPVVDYILVVDTGSSDGTQRLIINWLHNHNIDGTVIEEPWRNFSYNRTFALERLRERSWIDYTFVIDADDVLMAENDFNVNLFKASLYADLYDVKVLHGGITHRRAHLFRNQLPFCYKGVLHEYLDASGIELKRDSIDGIYIVASTTGARNDNPRKYADDAELLELALKTEEDKFLQSRYRFYLAQSYRDAGEKKLALDNYLIRAELGFWDQEIYISLYEAGKLMAELDYPDTIVISTLLHATRIDPKRAEAYHFLSYHCRQKGKNSEGVKYGKEGLGLPVPGHALFVQGWIYEYGLIDEVSINAYWSHDYHLSLALCLQLLDTKGLPAGYVSRVVANAKFASTKLKEHATAPIISLPHSVIAPVRVANSAPSDTLVSIITPTAGRADFLRNCREHVLNQNYNSIEWLILDTSAEPDPVLANDQDGRVRYWHMKVEMSVGEKRNFLVGQANGEYIVHFDDDDFYHSDYVHTLISYLRENQCDLVNLKGWYLYDTRSSVYGYWDLQSTTGAHFRFAADDITLRTIEPGDTTFVNNHYGYGFSYAYRRSIWDDIRFNDLNWNEDADFFARVRERFQVGGFHDTKGLVLHVLHKASSSVCFPQFLLPEFLGRSIFPEFRS